jgi:tRNA nucleotidyltransferase (CCA-adding enzyme)
MAYHPEEGLVDLFGGMEDLKNQKIRCVGNPIERFTEDALRIMRAVRFSAQLGFEIEEETYRALSVLAPNLSKISAERIRMELEKTLLSSNPDYLRIAYETGMTAVFLPEWDVCMETEQNTPHHCYTVGEHMLHSLKEVEAERVLRLTMMLHDIAKPLCRTTDENGRDHFKGHAPEGEVLARRILRRLKYDNDTISAVCTLIRYHDDRPKPEMRAVRRALNRIGGELFPLYLKVRRADLLSQSTYRREEKLEQLAGVCACYQEILRLHQCTSLKELAVNGKDLIEEGYPAGRELGSLLQKLLEYVMDHPEENEKERLLELLPDLCKQ